MVHGMFRMAVPLRGLQGAPGKRPEAPVPVALNAGSGASRAASSWRRAIFSPGRPGNIVAAGAFHDRVRDGNGWDHAALPPEIGQGFIP